MIKDSDFVTIIIPTYNDWARLSQCLYALSVQSYPANKFEIIVVNNNSNDSPPDGFTMPENCRIIVESKPGSYSARNFALKNAAGNILGFTDSDCTPDRCWIENAVRFFKANTEFTRIAGHIELYYENPDKLTLAELYEKAFAFKQDISAQEGSSVTGNMFTYKFVFDAVGGFNDTLMSGGDAEWAGRANRAGFKIAYVPDVVIKHPARRMMGQLVKKIKRIAGSIGNNRPKAIKRFTKFLFVPPVKFLLFNKTLNTQESIKVFFLRYYLNLVRGMEELKVSIGKSANRE